MLQFSSTPPNEHTHSAFRLLRTPAKGKLHLYITSDNVLGCSTHYYSGRTVPCTGDGCEACEAMAGTRWHGYVAALLVKTNEQIVFEVTAAGAESLLAYRTKHGTLRGADCLASRVSPRPNARLHFLMKPLDLAHVDLPQPINVQMALCHVWGIPFTETEIADDTCGPDVVLHRGSALPTDRSTRNGNGRITAATTEDT